MSRLLTESELKPFGVFFINAEPILKAQDAKTARKLIEGIEKIVTFVKVGGCHAKGCWVIEGVQNCDYATSDYYGCDYWKFQQLKQSYLGEVTQ